jgi:hypothetical protein
MEYRFGTPSLQYFQYSTTAFFFLGGESWHIAP